MCRRRHGQLQHSQNAPPRRPRRIRPRDAGTLATRRTRKKDGRPLPTVCRRAGPRPTRRTWSTAPSPSRRAPWSAAGPTYSTSTWLTSPWTPASCPTRLSRLTWSTIATTTCTSRTLSASGAGRQLRAEGTVEPNTKVFLEEFRRDRPARTGTRRRAVRRLQARPPFPAETGVRRGAAPRRHEVLQAPHVRARRTSSTSRPCICDVVRNDRAGAQRLCRRREPATGYVSSPRTSLPVRSKARPVKPPRPTARSKWTSTPPKYSRRRPACPTRTFWDYQLDIFRRTMDEHLKERGQAHRLHSRQGRRCAAPGPVARNCATKYKSCQSQDGLIPRVRLRRHDGDDTLTRRRAVLPNNDERPTSTGRALIIYI